MFEKMEFVRPQEIEDRSMQLIEEGLEGRTWPEPEFSIVKRCIHTSADFDYAQNLYFSPGSAQIAVQALQAGASIITDTKMAEAGINKRNLESLGGCVYCFMDDPSVAQEARERGITRSAICMERGAKVPGKKIFAVGNAPTALIRLYEMIEEEDFRPDLIIGVPVGFVNVVEAKELIMQTDIPCMVAKGRKGGSTIAAAICNALIYFCK